MAGVVQGILSWSGNRDRDGHRNYVVKVLVESDYADGPAVIMQTPGLYIPGNTYLISNQVMGIQQVNDVDPWATCKEDMKVSIHKEKEGDPQRWWVVEQTFSTKADEKRCKDQQIDDPLQEPDRINGSFVKYNEEATHDRFGQPIVNSAWEQIRGPHVEFDSNRSSIKIEQNRPLLEIDLWGPMVNTVNEATLWDVPPRCVKLSDATWTPKYWGHCTIYFTRTFTFDIRLPQVSGTQTPTTCSVSFGGEGYKVGDLLYVEGGLFTAPAVLKVTGISSALGLVTFVAFADSDSGGQYSRIPDNPCSTRTSGVGKDCTVNLGGWVPVTITGGFDKDVMDEGTRCLKGHWDKPTGNWVNDLIGGVPPDQSNPSHFMAAIDRQNNPMKVILDGHGNPSGVGYGTGTGSGVLHGPGNIHIEKYDESDFTQLGIPLQLG